MPKLSYPKGRTAAALKASGSETADVTDPILENDSPSDEADRRQQPEPDEASAAFQKQIDALRKSEAAANERAAQANRDREDAIKRAKERDTENTQLKQTTIESRLDSLNSSLAAHQAEADAAQGAFEKASELGDFKGTAEAQRRMSKAEAAISQLEYGRVELETEIKTAKEQKPIVSNDPIDNSNLPDNAKAWLRSHRDYMTDPEKNAKLNFLHWKAKRAGHAEYSSGYLEFMEDGMEDREPVMVEPEEQDDPPEPRTRSMVSAPVSREAPSGSNGERPGTVRLSAAQKEAAKIAGITEKEYAENVLKLRAEKLNGNYGGAP